MDVETLEDNTIGLLVAASESYFSLSPSMSVVDNRSLEMAMMDHGDGGLSLASTIDSDDTTAGDSGNVRFPVFDQNGNEIGVSFGYGEQGSRDFIDGLNCDMYFGHRERLMDVVRTLLLSHLFEDDMSIESIDGGLCVPRVPRELGLDMLKRADCVFVAPVFSYGLYEIGMYNANVGKRMGKVEVCFPLRSVICPLCEKRRVNMYSLTCWGCLGDGNGEVLKNNNRRYFDNVLVDDVACSSWISRRLPSDVVDNVVSYVVDISVRPPEMYLDRIDVGSSVSFAFHSQHGRVFGLPLSVSFPVRTGSAYESLWWMSREDPSVYAEMQCPVGGTDDYDVCTGDRLEVDMSHIAMGMRHLETLESYSSVGERVGE